MVFQRRLLDPVRNGSDPPTYDALAGELKLRDAKTAANLFQTAIRKFNRVLRTSVEGYLPQGVGDRAALIDEELRDLHRVLADSHAFWEEPIEGDADASGEEWLFDPELLVLDDDATKIWSHADLSALWGRLVECRLTDLMAEIGASPSTPEGHPAVAHGEVEEWSTWSVRGLLESPRPPLEVLRILKEEAKRIGKRADIDRDETSSPPMVCALIYGVAIALGRARQ